MFRGVGSFEKLGGGGAGLEGHFSEKKGILKILLLK
jgi:hypothetical protein